MNQNTPHKPGTPPSADRHAAPDSKRGSKLLFGIVFGFLGISVAVHAVALTYVFSTQTDLVRSDYYAAGQNYDHEMALRAAGAKYPFELQVTPGDAGVVTVRLPHASADVIAAPGRVRLYRPGDAGLDRALPLPTAAVSDGVAVWRVPATHLVPGRWRVRLELDATTPLVVEVDRDVTP